MLSGQAATSWLRFFAIRGMGFKKLELVLDDFSQGFFVLRGGEIQSALGRCF
jgi:hypothetical protein